MKRLLFVLFVSFSCLVNAEEKFAMTFDRVPLSQLLLTFYDQCEKKGVVIDPSVKALDEPYTLNTPEMSCSSFKVMLSDLMNRAGVELVKANGYDVTKPLAAKDDREGFQQFIYRPRYRDALELADMSMLIVRKGSYAHQRRGAPVQMVAGQTSVPDTGSNGASITSKGIDKLVFYGPPNEVEAIQRLMTQIDVPGSQVEISAGVYEFQSGVGVGSAVNAAVSLFKSKIGLTIGTPSVGGSILKLDLPSIDVALSLLDNDNRFHYVARPKVLVKDGQEVSFTAGQDVRVVGQVTIDRNGNPIQSIATMNAGVSLIATPSIRGDIVDLVLRQLVSDFVPSPNSEPSVVRRELNTNLMMQPGYVYVVGGLQTNRKTQSKHKFFGYTVGDKFESSDTEIILLISVKPDGTGI